MEDKQPLDAVIDAWDIARAGATSEGRGRLRLHGEDLISRDAIVQLAERVRTPRQAPGTKRTCDEAEAYRRIVSASPGDVRRALAERGVKMDYDTAHAFQEWAAAMVERPTGWCVDESCEPKTREI